MNNGKGIIMANDKPFSNNCGIMCPRMDKVLKYISN